ncbi:hypothetical protein [Cognatilysobacter tabacisoli]|uniref:hypothetical protein n=1 Tax=Cognatilysobacter tabacisoli TaxID=2315424 RepID=UPI00130097D6|nr:hypothetical protein [Lysobacter tabacisoli]
MVVIMVHWLIKRGVENEQAFRAMWQKMAVDPNTGLYREFLTKAEEAEDPKFNTFSLTDPAYITYVNIGFWKDVESFDAAVGKYIAEPELRKPLDGPLKDTEMLAVYRHKFEFKIRERIIMSKVLDRQGGLDFPVADLK